MITIFLLPISHEAILPYLDVIKIPLIFLHMDSNLHVIRTNWLKINQTQCLRLEN